MASNAPVGESYEWLDHPTGVTEVVGSIPTWNLVISSHPAKQALFIASIVWQ